MIGIIILIVFTIAGIITGLSVEIPFSYSNYIAIAILACLDSVFGAFSANVEKKFSMSIFISGFIGNALIAILLVFIGEKLNVDIFLAAVIVYSTRLLNNFSSIRRYLLEKFEKKAKTSKIKEN